MKWMTCFGKYCTEQQPYHSSACILCIVPIALFLFNVHSMFLNDYVTSVYIQYICGGNDCVKFAGVSGVSFCFPHTVPFAVTGIPPLETWTRISWDLWHQG